jgi:hypothetical protein
MIRRQGQQCVYIGKGADEIVALALTIPQSKSATKFSLEMCHLYVVMKAKRKGAEGSESGLIPISMRKALPSVVAHSPSSLEAGHRDRDS